jgi:tetratricopeptide (TPR) repeat protein
MRARNFIVFIVCLSTIFCASHQKRLQRERELSPKYQYDVGTLHLNNNDPDEAIKCFKRTIQLDPDFYLGYNSLGLAYLMKGELTTAEQYFYSCLDINPSFSEPHNNLGTVYQEMKLYDKAEHQFQIAIEDIRNPVKYLAYFNLARLYYLQNKDQEALDNIKIAIKMKSDFVQAYNLEGIIYEKAGKYSEAINSYMKALKISPNDLDLNYNLAVAYFKDNRYEEAKQIFERIYPYVTDSEMKSKIEQYLKIIK